MSEPLLPDGDLLTTAEAAKLLRVGDSAVRRMVRLGKLKAVQIGPRGRLRFTRDQLEEVVLNRNA